ncbi:TM1812 family CRISPR-associated protein [uncultured Veillonella sp.]|uniref:TM1812 family CRISPR-associated protein n=1 Tax=uncultured Veillonella sp. TaxID=159268 RepID=UPI0025FDE9CD|nr:TM1812 family CRISPR-associated protein [uncultured Veillonella sp.]
MEHHIYLTFLSAIYAGDKFNRDKVEKTVINPELTAPFNIILQTSESALKYLLNIKNKETPGFILEKTYFFTTPEVTNTKVADLNKTTLNIFEEQIKTYTSNVVPHFDFDTSKTYIECKNIDDINNLKDSIIDMSTAIMKYYNAQPPEDTVILHVDLTGGPRTAIMLMIAIIRLVAFQGIQIGSILYANLYVSENNTKRDEILVYEGNSIYNIYDMITGFAEFNQFGSVNTLKTYIETLPTPDTHIKQLLSAMSDFSEAIRLSSRGMFQTAMEDINSVLTELEISKQTSHLNNKNDHKNFEFEALKLMSNKIQSTYKPVMDDKEDDLIYIDWCIQNGYLQQALALFSEFIPRVILKSQIISLNNTIFTAKTDVNGHASTKNFNKINELTGPLFEEIKEISDSIINKIIECFRIYLSNSLRKEAHRVRTQLSVNSPIRRELTDFPKLELQLLNEINTIIMEEKEKKPLEYLNYMTYNNDNNNLPSQLLQIMSNLALSGKAILQINQLPLEFRKYLLAFLQNQLELDKDIPTDLIIMNQQYEIEFTDSKKLYLVRNAFFKIFNNPNAKDIFTYLFRNLITYQYPLNLFPNSLCNVNGLILHPILKKHHDLIPKIVTILNLYRILKASRNDTAHARENKRGLFKKSTDIQEQIKLCLKEIRYIRDFMSRNTKL